MITLNKTQWRKIESAALAAYPREMCGILTDKTFYAGDNVHETPESAFTLDPVFVRLYSGKIRAIVHSHCRDPKTPEVFDLRTPSHADMQGAKASGVPWLIVGTEGETVTPPLQIPRVPSREYLGRPFIWFINDCYTLVQDYYRFELDIELPDHKADRDFKTMRHFDGLFDGHIENYGFKSVQTLDGIKNGDLLLIDNAGHKRNHLGVYHNGYIIHQDMLSISQPLENFIGGIHAVLKYAG